MNKITIDTVFIESSERQYRDMLEGIAWKDFSNQVLLCIEETKGMLVSCRDTEEIFRFQGRIEAMENMLILAEEILSGMEEDNKAKEDEDNNDYNEKGVE